MAERPVTTSAASTPCVRAAPSTMERIRSTSSSTTSSSVARASQVSTAEDGTMFTPSPATSVPTLSLVSADP